MSHQTGFEDLDNYLDYLELRGRRPITLKNYEIALRSLLCRLEEGGRHHTAETIDEEDLLWLNIELGYLSEQTRKSYIRLIAMMVQHFTGIDPGKKLGLLFNDDSGRKVHFMTLDDFVTLYREGAPVDRIILVLGAFMGLRRGEIAAIKESDIIDGRTMRIHGKGHGPQGKIAYMEIPPRVQEEIGRFMEWKKACPFGREGIYLVESGKRNHALTGMNSDSIGRRMWALRDRTGIEFSPHSLRRLYATTLYYDAEVDLVTIKNLMRHSKSETTVARYIAPMKKRENEAAIKLQGVFEKALGQL